MFFLLFCAVFALETFAVDTRQIPFYGFGGIYPLMHEDISGHPGYKSGVDLNNTIGNFSTKVYEPDLSKLPKHLFTNYAGYSSGNCGIDMISLKDGATRMKALTMDVFDRMYYLYMKFDVMAIPFYDSFKYVTKNMTILTIVFITIYHWGKMEGNKAQSFVASITKPNTWTLIIEKFLMHLFFHSVILTLVSILSYIGERFIGVIILIFSVSIDYTFIKSVLGFGFNYPGFSENGLLCTCIIVDITILLIMSVQFIHLTTFITTPGIEHLRLIVLLGWSYIDIFADSKGENLTSILFNFSSYVFFYVLACVLQQIFVIIGMIVSIGPNYDVYETVCPTYISNRTTTFKPNLLQVYEDLYKMVLIPEMLACYSIAVCVYERFYQLLKTQFARDTGISYSFKASIIIALLSYVLRRIFRNIWIWIGDELFTYKLLFIVFVYNSWSQADESATTINFSFLPIRLVILTLLAIPIKFISFLNPFNIVDLLKLAWTCVYDRCSNFISITHDLLTTRSVSDMKKLFDGPIHSSIMDSIDLVKTMVKKLWNLMIGDFRFTTAVLVSGSWTSILYGFCSTTSKIPERGYLAFYHDYNSLVHKSMIASMTNMTTYMLLQWASTVRENYTDYSSTPSLPVSDTKLYSYCKGLRKSTEEDSTIALCDNLNTSVTQMDITIHTAIGSCASKFPLLGMLYNSAVFIPMTYLYVAYLIYENNFIESFGIEAKDRPSEIHSHSHDITINILSFFGDLTRLYTEIYHFFVFVIAYIRNTFVSLLEKLSKSKHLFLVIYSLIPLSLVCITVILTHLLSLRSLYYSKKCQSNILSCYLANLYRIPPFYSYFSSILSYFTVNALRNIIARVYLKHDHWEILKTNPWLLVFGSIDLLAISVLKKTFDLTFKRLTNMVGGWMLEFGFVFGLSWIILILFGHEKLLYRHSTPDVESEPIKTFSYYFSAWIVPSVILIAFWLPEEGSMFSILSLVQYEFKTLILNRILDWRTWFGKENSIMIIGVEATYSMICNVIIPGLFDCYKSEKLIP